jgi:hypothetical protein
MDFIKKNYEKVLLGVVLLGLVVGAVLLLLMIPRERQVLLEQAEGILKRPAKPLPDLEVSRPLALIQRGGGSGCLDLTTTNKVFNPVQWQRKPDGSVLKVALGNEIGPEAVVVTKITPLYLTITLDSVENIGGTLYYVIVAQNEAAPKPADRGRKRFSAVPNVKKDVFVIREVRGAVDNPSALVLELVDGNERITLSKEAPFRRVAGYTADFRYPPENKTWPNLRVGAGLPGTTPQIMIASEAYNVVAITKNEVVLSARSNNKKTPRPFTPAP